MITLDIYFLKYQIIWATQIIRFWKICCHGHQSYQKEFENKSNLDRLGSPKNNKVLAVKRLHLIWKDIPRLSTLHKIVKGVYFEKCFFQL